MAQPINTAGGVSHPIQRALSQASATSSPSRMFVAPAQLKAGTSYKPTATDQSWDFPLRRNCGQAATVCHLLLRQTWPAHVGIRITRPRPGRLISLTKQHMMPVHKKE